MFNGLKMDAAVKDVMRRDVMEARLTEFPVKPQKNSIIIIASHNREPYCLEDRRQSFLSHSSV